MPVKKFLATNSKNCLGIEMKRASIDLGTNTCLLLIQEITGSTEAVLHDESTIVRLGQGVAETKLLNSDAMVRTLACLKQYAEKAKSFGIAPESILAVGTAQARDAANAKPFFDEVEKSLGIHFRILSGNEEAKATFLGAALPSVHPDHMVVLDIGGGSTELVSLSNGNDSIFGESLAIGAVKLTERYLKSNPVTDEEYWQCEAAIDSALEKMKDWRTALPDRMQTQPTLVAVAGTAVTLAMLQEGLTKYDPATIEKVMLTQGDAHRLVEELKWRTVAEKSQMPGMEAKRADVILAGALIFWRTMEVLDFKQAFISTRGLRYGVFKL